jgi:hypothetical protein
MSGRLFCFFSFRFLWPIGPLAHWGAMEGRKSQRQNLFDSIRSSQSMSAEAVYPCFCAAGIKNQKVIWFILYHIWQQAMLMT